MRHKKCALMMTMTIMMMMATTIAHLLYVRVLGTSHLPIQFNPHNIPRCVLLLLLHLQKLRPRELTQGNLPQLWEAVNIITCNLGKEQMEDNHPKSLFLEIPVSNKSSLNLDLRAMYSDLLV